MRLVNFVQGTDHLKTKCRVSLQEVVADHARRGRRGDAHQNGRNRPSRVHGRGRIAEMAAEETDDLVTEFGEGACGVAGRLAIGKELYQSGSEGEFSQRSDGADGFANDG